MRNISLEKPEAVFLYAPVVEDICIELGVDRTDAETITCMYEVFKRVSGNDHFVWDEDAYNEGYKEGWNDAIEEAESRVDDISWEIGTLKKQ
jgi:hypothetical protein